MSALQDFNIDEKEELFIEIQKEKEKELLNEVNNKERLQEITEQLDLFYEDITNKITRADFLIERNSIRINYLLEKVRSINEKLNQ